MKENKKQYLTNKGEKKNELARNISWWDGFF